jgi:hypothetical protein
LEQGRILSLRLIYQSLSSGGATELPPGEISNIFDHLGEAGNKMKSK